MHRDARPALRRALAAALAGAALASTACGGSPPPVAATPTGPAYEALIAEGRTLYETNCARCHGGDLKGGPHGPPLLDAVYGPAQHPDDTFVTAVRQGVKPHHWNFGPMPPVEGLADEQVAAIIAFVRAEQLEVGIR